jgi:hypothetical protein
MSFVVTFWFFIKLLGPALETKMGEVIAFEPNIVGARMKPWPGDLAKIVVFTGVWHEPMNDRGGKKKRAPSLGGRAALHERSARLRGAAPAFDDVTPF